MRHTCLKDSQSQDAKDTAVIKATGSHCAANVYIKGKKPVCCLRDARQDLNTLTSKPQANTLTNEASYMIM